MLSSLFPSLSSSISASLLTSSNFNKNKNSELVYSDFIQSNKKRPLDELDQSEQFEQQQQFTLFPDTFQRRKIAKRPTSPPSTNQPLSPQTTISSAPSGPTLTAPPTLPTNILPINTDIRSPDVGQLKFDSNTFSSIFPTSMISLFSSTMATSTLSPQLKCNSASNANVNATTATINNNNAATNITNNNNEANQTFVRKWTNEEDELLIQAVNGCGSFPPKCWKAIATKVPGRNEQQCLQRWRNVLACKYRKGVWTPEEDEILRKCYENTDGENQNNIFKQIKKVPRTWDQIAGEKLNRTAKQCRERWANILDPNLRNDDFTEEEDKRIIALHEQHGNQWKKIATFLNGRTGNRVKSRFYSLSRKFNIGQTC